MYSCIPPKDKEPLHKKIVIVGDGACGKTSLLSVLCRGLFTTGSYAPAIFDNFVKEITVNNKKISTELWDTAGQEGFDMLRTLSYPNSDIVLLVFSIDNQDSLENIYDRWVPEVKRHCPYAPLLLVGCKTDLRTDSKTILELKKQSLQPISKKKGKKVAKMIGARGYVECSAKFGEGVDTVFITALKNTMVSSKCIIM